MKLFLLKLDEDLHTEIKTQAAKRAMTMQAYLREIIIQSISDRLDPEPDCD